MEDYSMTDYPKTYQLPKGIIVHERRHLAANGFFFAGGIYFENEKGVRQYKYGQMYVEVYVPRKITQPYPLIFYHGGGQSGLCWMETADKREGWADFFLKEGYVVYVVDVPARGRSAYHVDIDGPLSRLTSELCYQYFAGNTGNWETAKLHTQWPETMEKDPRGYDQNYDQLCSAMVDQIGVVRQQEAVRDASIKLLERTGQAIIVTHSLSGPYG
jgi:pimeloyl-ACP methyl ester carboxylesterase